MRLLPSLLLALSLTACHKDEAVPTLLACPDPLQSCILQANGQPLRVHFSATPAPMRPFDLEVMTEAENVEASFQMQDMEMGFNRYRLMRNSGQTWHARIMLPACIQGRSDWKLLLDIKTAGITRRYELPFTSGK